MRALTLQPAPGEQQQASCGRSLSSNYSPPNLENKFLAQTSVMKPQSCSPLISFAAQPSSCPSLQPSRLSSTSSSLLSSSSLVTSPLLSTQNKLLTSVSPSLSFSLTSSVPDPSLTLPTSLSSGTLLSRFAQPPSFLHHGLGREQKDDDGGEKESEEISEVMQSCFEETSMYSEDSTEMSEEESDMEETDAGTNTAHRGRLLQVLEPEVESQKEKVVVTLEEFPEIDRGNENSEEELKDKKYLLLNAVCCSLVMKSTAPGQKGWNARDSIWLRILKLGRDISVSDPEFLLKVAVYTRQKLNIRITANFLLALAASHNPTKPHLRRYFCAAVQLPSDWLEVVRIYTTCFKRSLPMCLKKAMADKFKEFNEYQLAKYNTRKHRCKHNRNKPKGKKPSDQQLKQWADMVRSDATILKKFLQAEDSKAAVVVDKKQSEFSIKKMIKKFHIKEPAEYVMAILGKKYPSDQKTFTHSGLKGEWDRERAGQRMKLKEPQTWERLLSLEGNKAATWEKLIDSKSLPFMAMLRNLRNMIIKGISEDHHKKILKRLTNKKAVIESRQFPFRFLAAYKVILEIRTLASATEKVMPTAQEILKGILKKIPKSRRFSRLQWETTSKSRMKVALGVPFIYRMYQMKRAQLIKANQRLYTVDLLDRYCKALETAVQISCRYNVPPLPGRTVILLSSRMYQEEAWGQKQDFCLPPDPEQQNKEDKEENQSSRRKRNKEEHNELTPTLEEVAALLALMISSSAEDCQLCLTGYNHYEEVKLESDVLLDNVRKVVKQLKTCQEIDYRKQDNSYFYRTFTKKNKVNNIILLTDYWVNNEIEWAINNYRNEINKNALVVKISLSDSANRNSKTNTDRNFVELTGFSEQILRFVAERGSSRLLDHVEHLDKLYNIPPPKGAKRPQTTDNIVSIPASPKLRWRGVRVFISSTFRDMQSERDVLVQSVFPELRRRAAQHCIYLQEVELRWGLTEEESERATELCLSEVCRSHMLVGILGERYGLVPPRPVLPDLPQYSWLASAPADLSITELEIRQFQALYPDVAHQRMFFYFRDPNIINSIPVGWRSHFAPESADAKNKMTSLKKRLTDSNVKVTENYSCEWGGVVEGKPYLKNLEDFGKAVLEDLWMAIEKQFVEEDEEQEAASEVHEQEVHRMALQRQFFGRSKLLSAAVEIVEQAQTKGQMMVVEGGPAEGKTVFMAALAEALRTGVKSRKKLACNVVSYSTAASQTACSVENLLRCLIQCLRKVKDTKKESPAPHSYKDFLAEFHATLTEMKKTKPLVLLVDGVDFVRDSRGQLSCDWIPQQLPQGVCLVVSITSKAALLQTLVKRTGTVLFSLGQLTMLDRKEIVQKELDAFGKKLSDSAFNNQLQTLIMKKGAVNPLYLHLACEDLRNFASFDKLKESLQDLPESLSKLVQYSLERLCSHYRGMLGLRWALAVLTISATGLKESDFYSVLNTCNDLSSWGTDVKWEEVLQLSRKPKGRIPMATFTRIVQSLQSLIGQSHCHNTNDLLALNNPEVKRAFEDFLFPTESDRTRAHLILAAHLWVRADPQGQDTFLHCEVNSVMHLPSSLIQSGQLEALQFLLTNFYFMYANVRNGLMQHLLETYRLHAKECEDRPALSIHFHDYLDKCVEFLFHHASTLSSWPTLFIQEALRDPLMSPAHNWAQKLVTKGGIRLVEYRSADIWNVQEISYVMSTLRSEPTCLTLSPDEEFVVVGTGEGMLYFLNSLTGQEVKSLVSSCDGISSCVFLKDGRLATTSFDGRIEVWDVENGCRTALIDGHTNTITASAVTADKKHLATVSLDFMLKVWSSAKGNEVASLSSTSPLNCVTFDPAGHLLAAGCWNGNVVVWNWLQNKTLPLLCGHQQSVRSVTFYSSSSMLCSGSVSGEVRVWSVPTSTCVGCFQAHSGATEAVTFLEEGSMLLTASSDHTIQLWSGGLGRSVGTLKRNKVDESEKSPPLKKLKTATPEPAALCVAVNGDYVAVGYHGDSIRIFSLDSGEKIQTIEYVGLSILSLLWVTLDAEKTKPELLVASGSDKRMRVFKTKEGEGGMMGSLESVGMFSAEFDTIIAMAQNSTYLATASEGCSIFLWLLSEMALDPLMERYEHLKGHTGGVTCLAFSPDGARLLSGGKDQALMLWDVSSSPVVLSKPFPHAHRDWITGCVWTPDCVLSSSNDGRLCLWDLEAGQCLREISWKSPLTSVCCQGQLVMAGCADGRLHVWNWETNVEISHITAHKQRINHCSLLPNTDEEKEVKAEERTVITASDDGTVKLWKPLQVEHFNTFQGHSGAIKGILLKEDDEEFLTVSEDRSLRSWTFLKDYPPNLKGSVAALCFSENGESFLVGYESGLLELWHHNVVVGDKQVSNGPITAVCFMPDDQVAVSYMKLLVVDVLKVVWKQQHSSASLVKSTSYKVADPVVRLIYCSVLLGVCTSGQIVDVTYQSENDQWRHLINSWSYQVRIQGVIRNDLKSVWLVGEQNGKVSIGFILTMGSKAKLDSSFSSVLIESEEEDNNDGEDEGEEREEKMRKKKEKRSLITAITVDKEFVVCGDMEGNMWFNQPPDLTSWSSRKPAHSDRISQLRLTDTTIISASYDRTVKLWDRNTKKQVGMFVSGGPVLVMEVNPEKPTEVICGDEDGKVYVVFWKE